MKNMKEKLLFFSILTFLFLSFIIIGCSSDTGSTPEPTNTATVKGTVVNQGGSRIEGAIIYVDGLIYGELSDANGNFVLSNLTPGQHTVTILKEGYDTYTETFTVQSGISNKTFQLTTYSQGKTGTLSGYVNCGATGGGIPGAVVRIEGTTLTTTTNNEGYYIINNVPSGNQKVLIDKQGYEPYFKNLWIFDNFENKLTAILTPENN